MPRKMGIEQTARGCFFLRRHPHPPLTAHLALGRSVCNRLRAAADAEADRFSPPTPQSATIALANRRRQRRRSKERARRHRLPGLPALPLERPPTRLTPGARALAHVRTSCFSLCLDIPHGLAFMLRPLAGRRSTPVARRVAFAQGLAPRRGCQGAHRSCPRLRQKAERWECSAAAKFDKMLDPVRFWGAHRRLECAQSDSTGPNSLDGLRSHLSGSACWLSRSRDAF
jgi:hypothetical protein